MSVDRILATRNITLFLLVIFTPVYFSLGAQHEGTILPVVKNMTVVQEIPGEDDRGPYVDFFIDFDKVRQCEFVNLTWYDDLGRKLRLDFEPDNGEVTTRPVGVQVTGPWRLYGVDTLEGTRAVAEHDCHPFFNTFSEFYPT